MLHGNTFNLECLRKEISEVSQYVIIMYQGSASFSIFDYNFLKPHQKPNLVTFLFKIQNMSQNHLKIILNLVGLIKLCSN